MQPAAVELLRALAGVLCRWGRWYLFGAQAVTVHGLPRLSADVDVTLQMSPDDPARFTQEMKEAGFDLLVGDPEFLRRTHVLPFLHRATGMPVDVVLAASGLEEEFLGRTRLIDIGGAPVPVITVDDLIVAKILAGRPKDLEDVRGLLRIHGSDVDLERIRRILRLLEEALSQSDLLPALESILEASED
jgi:hypothetical protein